ncbi:Ppx/GppA phosphatase family protein [Tychonema sp. LEGE 07203]|uniref:Ppx/GppA phosphatase family protein n=1 Tax=Tychonema sp. LEGE 07203 TaxID=1828671 RepID=UPI00187EC10B|nr:Ppx/GppA phosphatase family protein [Tychonema sp. LEGE 07203]MBE9094632.1 Ppx/GppA family phosphatase [Tychonema sp. LEGE 07203]
MVNSIASAESNRIIAAIDMGTNSFHMVVARIDPKLPAFEIIAREKDTVRLGDSEAKTGCLKSEVMDRAIVTLRRFLDIAKTFHAEQVVAVATSAVREAPNGRDFLKRVADELDLNVSLISGQEEARRIYLGVLSGMEFNNQSQVIIDIGGGSTELILGDSSEQRCLTSTKIGAVRLTKEFVKTDPISREEFAYLQAYIRVSLERPIDELRSYFQAGETLRLIGTAGTIETLASINARENLGSVPSPLTGYELSLKDLRDLVNRFRKLSYSERLAIPGMSDKRAEIILVGALILQEAMTLLGMESLTVCDRSLREGVIVDWMLSRGLIESRLRYQGSIRQRSIGLMADKYQVNSEQSEITAAFALKLFDQTQGILHNWGAEERELLWAAAILHNCGLYISHSAHHKHSYYLIRNGELLGYTETEIEVIANLARYHRKSPPKKKHENFVNLPKKYREVVTNLHPFLRLAVALDRRQIGAIADFKSEHRPEIGEFHLRLQPLDSEDDCALEMWSLDYKKPCFEDQYNLKLVATLEGIGG